MSGSTAGPGQLWIYSWLGPTVDIRIHSQPRPTVDVGPSIARPTVDARPTTVGPGHPQSAWVHSWPRTTLVDAAILNF